MIVLLRRLHTQSVTMTMMRAREPTTLPTMTAIGAGPGPRCADAPVTETVAELDGSVLMPFGRDSDVKDDDDADGGAAALLKVEEAAEDGETREEESSVDDSVGWFGSETVEEEDATEEELTGREVDAGEVEVVGIGGGGLTVPLGSVEVDSANVEDGIGLCGSVSTRK